jgi:hypothetical protein
MKTLDVIHADSPACTRCVKQIPLPLPELPRPHAHVHTDTNLEAISKHESFLRERGFLIEVRRWLIRVVVFSKHNQLITFLL